MVQQKSSLPVKQVHVANSKTNWGMPFYISVYIPRTLHFSINLSAYYSLVAFTTVKFIYKNDPITSSIDGDFSIIKAVPWLGEVKVLTLSL